MTAASNPWSVAIAGTGRIAGLDDTPADSGPARPHAQAFHQHSSFAITAVVNTAPDALKRFRGAWSVPNAYPSLADMLRVQAVDVLVVSTPDPTHYALAMEALSSASPPRVLLIEKPVCLLPDELERLRALSASAGVTVGVNHTRRFDPAHQVLARRVRSGGWGALVDGRCTYYGGWLHNGVHAVDTLRMLFDGEPEVIAAEVVTERRTGDPDLAVKLRWGDAGVELQPFDQARYQLFEIELRFTAGRVRMMDFGLAITMETVTTTETGERVLVPSEDSPLDGLGSPLAPVVGAVAACMSGEDAFRRIGADLDTAAGTMSALWRAIELAGAPSRTAS